MKTRSYHLSKSLLIFIILVIVLPFAKAQPPDSLWFKEYGNLMDDVGFDAIEGEDGVYIVIGKTEVTENNWDAYVAKLDNNGDIIWENTYGGAQDEQIVSVCPGLYFGYVMIQQQKRIM